MTNKRLLVKSLLAAAFILLTSACGQKGALLLTPAPDSQQPAAPTEPKVDNNDAEKQTPAETQRQTSPRKETEL